MRRRCDGLSRECGPSSFEDLVTLLQEQLLICCSVMPGLDPGIHVFLSVPNDVDGRDNPGHDDVEAGERKMPIVDCDSLRQERGGRFFPSMLNTHG